MTKYILVLKSGEDAEVWRAVAATDTRAELEALPCYRQTLNLSKAEYAGVLVGPIQKANCVTPGILEDGNIYRVTGP
jgi:hypothetical protein